MLALGPFFIAFLLFDGSRGLFEGWLRVLGGAALGALGAAIVLGVELAMLEPWLTYLLALRNARQPIAGVPVELFVVTFVFALALLATLIAAARLAYGFRLPPVWREAPALAAAALRGEKVAIAGRIREGAAAAADRSRAATVAAAIAATQRRETSSIPAAGLAAAGGGGFSASSHGSRHLSMRESPASAPPPRIGQSFRRRTRGRVSASSGRRDRAS
jgi:type IV secretion system protein VirB6